MEKIKKLLATKFAEQVITVFATLVLYTLLVLIFTPTFKEWFNCVTDVMMGAILCQICITTYETVKSGKTYNTWQYYVCLVVSVIALGFFFYASRANSITSMIVGLSGSAVSCVLNFVVRKFMYKPSTMALEELIDANWDRMKAKAKKIGYEKFLSWEKSFRCYPTDSGTIEGDLCFDRPYYTVEKDGKTIPLSYNGAVERGLTDVATIILDDLVRELKASNLQ